MNSTPGFFTIVLFGMISPTVSSKGTFYTFLDGQKLNLSTATISFQVSDYSACRKYCFRHASIFGMSFRKSDQFCFCFLDSFLPSLHDDPEKVSDTDFVSSRMVSLINLLIYILFRKCESVHIANSRSLPVYLVSLDVLFASSTRSGYFQM